MIAVFDANVWVSALQFGGVPREALLRAAFRRELVTSEVIQDEIARTLCGKFRYKPGEVQKVLAPFLQRTRAVQITGSVQGVCRDPEDDHLIECAQKAGAEIIVTGGKDPLSLERVEDIRMLSPRQCLGIVP